MTKVKSVVSLSREIAAQTVTVTVQGFAPLIVRHSELADEVNRAAWCNGIGQKLVDSAALSRDPVTGKPADASAKHAAILDTFNTLANGAWNSEREGGGAVSILFEALCAMMPDESPESIRATLDGMTDAEKRGLPLDPEVAPFYKTVKDARDAKRGAGVDTKAVLAKFKAKKE